MRESGVYPRVEDPNRKSIMQECEVQLIKMNIDHKLQDKSDSFKLDHGINCVICLNEISI